jgi:hypothetical protein
MPETKGRSGVKYTDRDAKDRQIIMAISSLSLPERYQHLRELETAPREAEAEFERRQKKQGRTQKQEAQLLADQDGIIELRYRIGLERAEYLAQKEITPDYVEPTT